MFLYSVIKGDIMLNLETTCQCMNSRLTLKWYRMNSNNYVQLKCTRNSAEDIHGTSFNPHLISYVFILLLKKLRTQKRSM